MAEKNLNLHEDLVMEILPRLPVKSLVRFKCVAKSWKNLFTTPSFVSKQLSASSLKHKNYPFLMISEAEDHNVSRHCLKLLSNGDPSPNLYKPFAEKHVFHIYGPCNGIFCLNCQYEDLSWHLILWNPATREVKFLPPPLCPPSHEHSLPVYGFGIDPKRNDCKIAKLFMRHTAYYEVDRQPAIADVYCLTNDSWRIINDVAPSCYIHDEQFNSYANGVHCWMAGPDYVKTNGDDPLMPGDRGFQPIVCFDMSSETFQQIKATLTIDRNATSYLNNEFHFQEGIAVINDRISYFYLHGNNLRTLIEFATMNEYNGADTSWTNSTFTLHYERPKLWLAFEGCWKDGEVILSGLPQQEFLTSFKDDGSELRSVQEIPVSGLTCLWLREYTESIAPLTV